jgi:hypothetical protein
VVDRLSHEKHGQEAWEGAGRPRWRPLPRRLPQTCPTPLTPAIVKFEKSASSEDKQKIIADIKAAGGSIVRDDHVDSSSTCRGWVSVGVVVACVLACLATGATVVAGPEGRAADQ